MGLNTFVAWVFSGESIGVDWVIPSFTHREDEVFDDRVRLDHAVERVGFEDELHHAVGANRIGRDSPDDASVLRRCRSVLAAPVKKKTLRREQHPLRLSARLHASADEIEGRLRYCTTHFTMPNPPLGDELSERRGKRGWTQRDLAQRLDASVSAVSAWENNRYTPREEIATALVDLFGESTRDLSTHERRERD